MMESLADPILRNIIIGLAVGLVIPLIAVGVIVFIAITASHRRQEQYQQLSTEGVHNLRYCSAKRFMRWLKFIPWEGVGVLRFHGQELVFDARSDRGRAFTVRAPVERLLFHGRRNWFRNGFLPWLLFKSDSGDYYLCVETGPLIFGAGGMTRDLLASIKKQAELGEGGKASPATS